MMSNRSADILFQLIHSLEKSEKRHFKLYIKRSSSREELKIVKLFDVIDKMHDYDDQLVLKKLPSVTKPQLANLKAHLYKQIMASLRLLKSADSLDLQLNEQFDYAHILYKKGLFIQSLRLLDRVKETARNHYKFNFLAQVISLEKRIESLHITRSMRDRAERLSAEAIEVSEHIDMVARLSNLSIQLYSWFIRYGHARNKEDEENIKLFMKEGLPANAEKKKGFYERLYLYQSYCWYAFIRQDFLQQYRYTRKWVDLFKEQPLMIRVETGHYIKGQHNLLNALFDLRHYDEFEKVLHGFERFAKTERVQQNTNFSIHAFLYITHAKINQHFMLGTFKKGLQLVEELEQKMKEYEFFLDRHQVLVMEYKIATLYFGSGDYDTCSTRLQKIINEPANLRNDLQCYVRLLNLLSHYEMGNTFIIESQTKSVYRFMAKMKNLTVVEEEILRFLKRSFELNRGELVKELENFLQRIKHHEKNRFETRAFAYLDIISWVESKVYRKPMGTIIHEKYMANKEQRQ